MHVLRLARQALAPLGTHKVRALAAVPHDAPALRALDLRRVGVSAAAAAALARAAGAEALGQLTSLTIADAGDSLLDSNTPTQQLSSAYFEHPTSCLETRMPAHRATPVGSGDPRRSSIAG
jgi:hypothetical protein